MQDDRVSYLVTMEVCFDDPELDFDEDWILKKLRNTGMDQGKMLGASLDAFQDGLKNHLAGGGSYVITKITADGYYDKAEQTHLKKINELLGKNSAFKGSQRNKL